MSRAFSDFRSFSAATGAVLASLLLVLPFAAQSDEEQRRYEEWKQQQKAKSAGRVVPSATVEWVTVGSDSSGVEKQIVDQLISQINNVLNKGVSYAPQGAHVGIIQKSRGRAESIKGAYQSLRNQKAIAACIAWGASRLGNLAARSIGLAFKGVHLSEGVQSATFQCERGKANKNITDCECTVVAKNDRFEFQVPKSFLTRVSN